MDSKTEKLANQIYRDYMAHREVVCNCGGPQYGTDHSPDCELVLWEIEKWEDAKEEAEERIANGED